MFDSYFKKNKDSIYGVFRIVVGLLFASHGAQKLLGLFGGNTVELMSKFGAAGVIELVGGLMIAFGFFTSIAALLGALDMIGAFVLVHAKSGINPVTNGGELVLIYLVAFLVMLAYGPGKWSINKN